MMQDERTRSKSCSRYNNLGNITGVLGDLVERVREAEGAEEVGLWGQRREEGGEWLEEISRLGARLNCG